MRPSTIQSRWIGLWRGTGTCCSGTAAEGETSGLRAALTFLRDDIDEKGSQLKRARRATRGMNRLSQPVSRRPCALPMMAMAANMLAYEGDLPKARATAMLFITYPRPGAVCTIKKKHLAPPTAKTGGSAAWAVTYYPSEGEQPNKTKEYDLSVNFDNAQFKWFDAVLERLRKGRPEERMHGIACSFARVLKRSTISLIRPPFS